MNKYEEMPAAEFAALLRDKESIDNRELLDEAARRIDHKETNAEKLARYTEELAESLRGKCEYCAYEIDCQGKTCEEGIQIWLESEAGND